MPRTKRTDDERLAALNAEIARLAEQAKKLEATKRAKDARVTQRRAFLIGEALLAQPVIPEPFKGYLAGILAEHAKRPADRAALADFLGESAPAAPDAPAPETDSSAPAAPKVELTPEPEAASQAAA